MTLVDRLKELNDQLLKGKWDFARHRRTIKEAIERIAYLEGRLEIDCDTTEKYDGIYCRDETIRLLEIERRPTSEKVNK